MATDPPYGRACAAKEATASVATLQPFVQTCRGLATLRVTARLGRLTDDGLERLAAMTPQCVTTLRVFVPMNALTLHGLRRFVDIIGDQLPTLRDVSIDISGNCIRGDGFGVQLSRLAVIPSEEAAPRLGSLYHAACDIWP